MLLDERPRLGYFVVLLLVLVFIYVAMRSTAQPADTGLFDRLIDLLTRPEASKGPLKDVLGPVDVWFKNVSGLSLTQILMAIWRIVVWIISWILSMIWRVIGSIQTIFKK